MAEYIGGVEQNDLAVIKIDLDKLPVASFGSSSNLRIGEFAMAIGNPLHGSGRQRHPGVISGIDRRVQAETGRRPIEPMRPAPAAAAPGQCRRRSDGINTIKIATTAVEGIGFAIPIARLADRRFDHRARLC